MSVIGARCWPACRSLSRPLTILGCERRVFMLSVTFGAAAWNALNSLLVGLLLAIIGYVVGLAGTREDPHMLVVVKAVAGEKVRYDPAKRPASIEGIEIVPAGQEASE